MSEPGGSRGRKFLIAALLVLAAVILFLTVTSAQPSTPVPGAPNAEAVAAGRDAYGQLRSTKGSKGGVPVVLGAAQLAGLSAVASHGFRPDRLAIAIDGKAVVVHASRHLPFGRWLNLTMRAEGPSKGFPITRLKIGMWNLPPRVSRWVLQAGRLYLERRVSVPPLDVMVRNFQVQGANVSALISLPGKSGLVDEMANAVSEPVDADSVLRVYCALADMQRKKPNGEFTEQVHRAFSLRPESTSQTDFNRSAFIALAMLIVDDRVGDFARLTSTDLGKCRMPVIATSIYGRQDWPKHWALSAAIAVGAGTQLSEAAGEWKELADSLARQSQFAIADPTGFSLSDLAADRAGFRTTHAAWQPEAAERMAAELAHATPEQLLPRSLVIPEVALSNDAFVRSYGNVDDPRFRHKVQEIDAVLDRTALH